MTFACTTMKDPKTAAGCSWTSEMCWCTCFTRGSGSSTTWSGSGRTPRLSLGFYNPTIDIAAVGDNLALAEKQGYLVPGALQRVRAVDEVTANLQRQVAADGPRRSGNRVRGAHGVPHHVHRVRPLQNGCND